MKPRYTAETIERLVSAMRERHTIAEISDAIGVTPQCVHYWRRQGAYAQSKAVRDRLDSLLAENLVEAAQ